MPRLSIFLLGPFRVTLDDQALQDLGYAQVRALLAYLAFHSEEALARESLATLLWPDQSNPSARHNLRQALSKLRQAIQDPRATPSAILADPQAVQFNPASDSWLDVREFKSLLRACDVHHHLTIERCDECAARLERATELYRGEFLEGVLIGTSAGFEDWVVVQREELHRRVLSALSQLSNYHLARKEFALASHAASRQLQLEPFREEAHRELMQILAGIGERSAALAQYENCRRILRAELGVEPSAETHALYERIRTGGEPHPHNLPLPLPTLIGREQDLNLVSARLENPECRLITLTGEGGIGKTTLALRAAAQHLDQFDGTFWVSLAAMNDATQLPYAIAAALPLPAEQLGEIKPALLDYLRDKSLLLALDNFEQLLPCTDLLTEILRAAPRVKFLVTSREPLRLRSEWIVNLEGLDYPSKSVGAPPRAPSAYSAIELFVRRAQQIAAAFSPSAEDYAAIGQVCERLVGSPLGIELAAGWMNTFTCQTIAKEIEKDLDFLRSSLRDVEPRHTSLRAVLEHSWRLLPESERTMARRLSQLHNSFRRVAARAVAGATPHQLAALVSKSFLRLGSDERYTMHPLLKEFLSEKLTEDTDERIETIARHSEYFAGLMYELGDQAESGQQREASSEIQSSLDDMIAALHQAAAARQAALVNKIANQLYNFLSGRGRFETGYILFEQAAHRMEEYPSPTVEERSVFARVIGFAGIFSMWLTEYDRAERFIQTSLAIARQTNDPWQVSMCLHALGSIRFESGDYFSAKQSGEEALAISRAMGDSGKVMVRLQFLGEMALDAGSLVEARTCYTEALTMAQSLGHTTTYSIAIPLYELGVVACRAGDPGTGQRLLEASLSISRTINHRLNTADCLRALARLATNAGEYARAADLLRECQSIYAEINKKPEAALAIRNQGWLAECRGDNNAAREFYRASLDALDQAKQRMKWAPVQADLGRMLALLGEKEAAERLLNEALAEGRDKNFASTIALAENGLGILERTRGNSDAAQSYFRDALHTAVAAEEIYEATEALVQLGETLTEYAADEVALTVLGCALAHPATPHTRKLRAEATAQVIAVRLPREIADAARNHGKSLAIAELVEELSKSELTQRQISGDPS